MLTLALGNVYIHPTANIDPTAVVSLVDECGERSYGTWNIGGDNIY